MEYIEIMIFNHYIVNYGNVIFNHKILYEVCGILFTYINKSNR